MNNSLIQGVPDSFSPGSLDEKSGKIGENWGKLGKIGEIGKKEKMGENGKKGGNREKLRKPLQTIIAL